MAKRTYHKTTIEIDVQELHKAQQLLHTRGVKETVNTALRELNRREALRRAAEYVLAGSNDVPDEATWAAWREPRA